MIIGIFKVRKIQTTKKTNEIHLNIDKNKVIENPTGDDIRMLMQKAKNQ